MTHFMSCLHRNSHNDRTDISTLFLAVVTILTKDVEKTSWGMTGPLAMISVFGKTAVWRFFDTR